MLIKHEEPISLRAPSKLAFLKDDNENVKIRHCYGLKNQIAKLFP